MDGSEVTVVVLGEKGVGKSSFIEHCFDGVCSGPRLSLHARALICGRVIRLQVVESPGRHQLIPAIMVILLFDLTRKESFERLEQQLEVAQRVSPVALRAVVGTKADLDDRQVLTQEALRFCQGSELPMPYYETSIEHTDSILLAFQEIMARPLINDYVIKTTTEQEQKRFVHEVMEWAILSNSANILSHLRELSYPIPLSIIEKYPTVIRDYLLGEYPLREVARFKHMPLRELHDAVSWEDSCLMENDEDTMLTIQDTRPTIQVARTFHLMWRDISLPTFPATFLEEESMCTRHLTHMDLSCNKLSSLPTQLFQLPLLESLDISHNCLVALPGLELWKHDSQLQVIKASYNHLRGGACVTTRSSHSGSSRVICRALWHVDLSHNILTHFPPFLLHFSLKYLNISHNVAITILPLELGHMEQLSTLLLEGLYLTEPPCLVVEEGPRAILRYLQLKLEHRAPWGSVRVVIVGPHRSGKSTLVSKITGFNTVTNKALDVVEWKYRGNEIFSFRNKWMTFDLWDFSGEPEFEFVYSCFSCSQSLHLVVCDAREGVLSLATWLANIQCLSKDRVAVMVVFTHMDLLRSREERDKFRKTCLQWISYHNKQGGNGLFSLMATTSVRSLQGEDCSVLSSYESDPAMQEVLEVQYVKGPDIPLMPLVLKVHFINSSSKEGIASLKKAIYKIASGSYSSQLSSHSTLIARDVPYVYVQVEDLLRQLRLHHREQQEGQQMAFYTIPELRERLKKPLHQLQATEADFIAALKFIHQVGTVLIHTLPGSEFLVCVDPQVVGSLLQRTVCACRVTQQDGRNPAAIFIAITHLCMVWGVEPVLSLDQWSQKKKVPTVTSAHLLHFLCHLKVFAPLLPGAILLTPVIPHALPRSCDPDSTSLMPRRSYVFSYLPSSFHTHLISLLVGAVTREITPNFLPTSPNQSTPPANIPIILPTGVELYLWQRNMFVVAEEEGVRVWVRVREGDVGLDPLPNCGRIDIHLATTDVQTEAHWLRLLTSQIDKLVEEGYPGLVDSSRPQKVEIFVPLGEQSGSLSSVTSENITERDDFDLSLPGCPVLSPHDIPSSGQPLGAVFSGNHMISPSWRTGEVTSPIRFSNPTSSRKPSDIDSYPWGLGNMTGPTLNDVVSSLWRPNGMSSSPVKCNEPLHVSEASWEVLSKFSTTSHRLSIQQDLSDPHHKLVPLWECLQESFRTPVIRVDSVHFKLSHLIPDQLFADLSPGLLFRTKGSHPDHFLVSLEEPLYMGVAPPPPEASGMFVRSYYSFIHDDDILVSKPAGALKAFYLQSCLSALRNDLLMLQRLRNPHLVAPVGLQFCPPCLVLEASPFGSLHSWMRRLRRKMGRVDTHHIALQLLGALEFFHTHKTSYHSINSDNVLVWNLDPLIVKLSDVGITHKKCELCIYQKFLPSDHPNIKYFRLDYMCLGLLVYEMATGKRPYEDIYPLTSVVLAVLHGKVELNIEADHFLQKQGLAEDYSSECIATGCQRLCLQSCIDHCLLSHSISHQVLRACFSLCAGDHQWAPMRLLINMEAIVASRDEEGLVYWASGSRGLVTGTMDPITGILSHNILQEAPLPESGLFAHRRGKPVPIAVGRASGLALVCETKQLWVGTENGQMGSVYVFNLPDMRRHHHIHLQDAVLSVCAVNHLADKISGQEHVMCYRVLVGMANGTIIVFLGHHGGKVLDNPLQGPKIVLMTHHRKLCLAMTLTCEGQMWCSCGQSMEVYNISTLELIHRLTPSRTEGTTTKGDVITLMAVSGKGVWTVGRRSPIVRLWDHKTGDVKASYNVSKVIRDSSDSDITSMIVHGRALWLGTRDGFLLVLDSYLMMEGKEPLLGLQQCGQGKVKCIVPLTPNGSKMQVLCSLEYADEVSCLVLSWEYFPNQPISSKMSASSHLNHMSKMSATLPDLLHPSSHGLRNKEAQHCKSF